MPAMQYSPLSYCKKPRHARNSQQPLSLKLMARGGIGAAGTIPADAAVKRRAPSLQVAAQVKQTVKRSCTCTWLFLQFGGLLCACSYYTSPINYLGSIAGPAIFGNSHIGLQNLQSISGNGYAAGNSLGTQGGSGSNLDPMVPWHGPLITTHVQNTRAHSSDPFKEA